ncbi:meiosis protein MEI2 [Penicillium maclennaniae]|uniref:meiosis protein MEI2 n=1 Tax=Penicillium maclennaniae TaxID=1343394 RepID=UPI00253FE783|nr:meiosis protein MEI2 [Penicillium maclennaniae]KAJ5677460.1 meiosis protein MEI2 [Penicillium maclennaniae]
MSHSPSAGMLPSSGSGHLNSPSAQLATFSPFPEDVGYLPDSSPLIARALDYRARDPFRGFSQITQAEQQALQSDSTAIDPLTVSGFSSRSSYRTLSDINYGALPGASASSVRQGSLMSPNYSPVQLRTVGRASASRAHGRRFLVQNVSTDIECLDLLRQLPKKNYPTMIGPQTIELNTKGRFWIGFLDIREAKYFVTMAESGYYGWEVIPITLEEFNRETRILLPMPQNFDDSVLVTLYCGSRSNVNPANVVNKVKPILDLVGDVHSIQEVHFGHPSRGARLTVHELIARFFNNHKATNAVRILNSIRTGDFIMEVIPYYPESDNQAPRHWASTGKNRRETVTQPGTPPHRRAYLSPGGDPDSSPIPVPDRGLAHIHAFNSGQIHYEDTRTTMELKRILDTTSLHRYDFMYLRMDFEHNQNVGYAFVNFASFIDARDGRHWPGFHVHHDKIAEMSYATVQGKDALVEKFRNSPVILNAPDNRPKLFHIDGPSIGQEATFPPVNNFYILAKGVDRSQKNGLYRSGPRVDPQVGNRYYLYPDDTEAAQGAMPDRDQGSPIRASRGAFETRGAYTTLQRYGTNCHEPRSD